MLLRGSLDVRKSIHLADTQILQALSQFNIHEHKLKAMLIFTLKEPFFLLLLLGEWKKTYRKFPQLCWENEISGKLMAIKSYQF